MTVGEQLHFNIAKVVGSGSPRQGEKKPDGQRPAQALPFLYVKLALTDSQGQPAARLEPSKPYRLQVSLKRTPFTEALPVPSIALPVDLHVGFYDPEQSMALGGLPILWQGTLTDDALKADGIIADVVAELPSRCLSANVALCLMTPEYTALYTHNIELAGTAQPPDAGGGPRGAGAPGIVQNRGLLRQLLSERFNLSELKNLCFDLGIDFENLPDSTKGDKARELITSAHRYNKEAELLDMCRKLRPEADWAEVERPAGSTPFQAPFDLQLPEGTVIMRVYGFQDAANVRRFNIARYARSGKMDDLTNKCLHTLPDDVSQDTIRKFLANFSTFPSDGPTELDPWLHQMVRQHGSKFNLIVYDYSKATIPWEALKLKEGVIGKPHRVFIGSESCVSRWSDIRDSGTSLDPKIEDVRRPGKVLALGALPEGALAGWEVQQLGAIEDATIELLWDRLLAQPDCYALVYIGGASATDTRTLDLLAETLSNHFPSNQISGARPIFIIGTGWLNHRDYMSDGSAASLLAQVADGIFSLVGGDGAAATRLVTDLLALLPYKPAAEALQQVRANALDRINAKQAELGELITAFLFHYYGNPLLQLQLTPKEYAEEGGR